MATEYLIRSVSEPSNLALCPINPNWILEGQPVARLEHLSSSADGTASSYFWDCTAGRFNWFYSFDETLHILEGSVVLKSTSGVSRLVTAGDVVFFPAGSTAEWTVDSYIRKLAFCRTPLPAVVDQAKRIRKKLKRFLSSGKQEEKAGIF